MGTEQENHQGQKWDIEANIKEWGEGHPQATLTEIGQVVDEALSQLLIVYGHGRP